MNKKGQYLQMMNIYQFFFIVAGIVAIGLFAVIGASAFHMVGDAVLPTVINSAEDIAGSEGGTMFNMVSTLNDAIPWIVGIIYILALVFIVVLAYAYKISGEKYLIVLYLGLTILMILLCIICSNIYQDFYTGSGALALELQSMSLISYLILYSPMIISSLLAIGAIIIFSGMREEGL